MRLLLDWKLSARRFGHILSFAMRNYLRFRQQAVLIFAATMCGTAGVIVSTGYAAGGRQKVLNQFLQLGTNVITVVPEASRSTGGRARTGALVTTLTLSDWKAISQGVDMVAASSPTVGTQLRIRAGYLTKNTLIVGCRSDYFSIRNWAPVRGRTFRESDDGRDSRVVLLGATAARDLFGDADPTGEAVSINRVPFKVIGVLNERGQGLDASNQDDQAYVPLETVMHRLLNVNWLSSVVFQIDQWSHMDEASGRIQSLLLERHSKFISKGADFEVQSQKSLLDTQLAALARLNFLIRWIAISAQVVSSLGVLALTWIAVRNRTHEIGTRRAIGASRLDVMIQFFAEGVLGAGIGCGNGLLFSYGMLRMIDARMKTPFIFSFVGASEEVTLSVALYASMALMSSMRATLVEPMVALRSE